MYMALRDLQKGDSVTEVSGRYGYNSLTGFESAFRKVFGSMPSDFLKDLQVYEKAYVERKKKRPALSARCQELRETMVNDKTHDIALTGQFLRNYNAGWWSLPKGQRLPNVKLFSRCLCSMMRHHMPLIFDQELIVGSNFGSNQSIGDEQKKFDGNFNTTWYIDSSLEMHFTVFQALTEPEKAALREYFQRGFLSPREVDEILAHCVDTPGMSILNHLRDQADIDRNKFLCNGETEDEEHATQGFCMANTHSLLNYERVLRKGFAGIREDVRAARDAHETLWEDQKDLYDAMDEILETCCVFGDRYAQEAEKLAKVARRERAEELRQIAKVCRNVPGHPAASFQEALQSLWFAHMVNTWEDGINANSFGRLDQILYPYYAEDIKSGVLTKERAFELLCCFFLKIYRDYDVQHCTIGGCDQAGKDAVNELSYLMLDATESLGIIRCLSVRFSNDTPHAFLRRALEILRHLQKGIPSFFNDDVLIAALCRRGIELEDARDYAVIGCVEICVPGKTNPHSVSGRVNALKALEYALANGHSMMHPELQAGVRTGEPASFKTFAKLMEAVVKQLKSLIDIACEEVNEDILRMARFAAYPYKSILTDDCWVNGSHYNAGGSKYDYYQFNFMGLTNLADSLEVLRKFVYTEKKYTLEQVISHLRDNFPDEEVRLDFLYNVPKFGNGHGGVDSMASELMDEMCSYLETKSSKIGMGFHPQFFSFIWMYEYGKLTAATPDGRRRGDPLTGSISPMQGMDFNGLTALIGSLTQLPTVKVPGSVSTVIEIDPYLFTDINIDMIAGILKAAAQKGISNIQFNVISNETLLEAKKHPEKHRDLTVCVSGFILHFASLDSDVQDEIINRTKHLII